MKTLVLIPSRGGSKGVRNKGIKDLAGKPLIQYTVDAARAIFQDKDICVSTDSRLVKEVVENLGLKVPFIRPAELATDTSSMHEVMLHALAFYQNKGLNYDVLILLQPTSPLRTTQHVREAMKLYSSKIDMVVSVKETASNPYYVLFEENQDGYLENSKSGSFLRRQDCPTVWEYNGAIYIINVKSIKTNPRNKLKKVTKYVMDEFDSIDIDTPADWLFAECVMKHKLEKN